MISLYDAPQTYNSQLIALENFSKIKPEAADIHFLLGYHYMVGGHFEQAAEQFSTAAKLQPADTVSAQLSELAKVTSSNAPADKPAAAEAPAATEAPAPKVAPPAPVPVQKLTGKWLAERGEHGVVTLVMNSDGKFTWTYKNGDKTNEFSGNFSINDSGLLVLDASQSRMVASVELPQDDQLKFVLVGGPPGDAGMTFTKQPSIIP